MCLSLRDEQTRQHEVAALSKLPRRLPCRRLILTLDHTETITDAARHNRDDPSVTVGAGVWM